MRRLGVSGSTNGDRPIKAQLIVALVALIILLAVPLYLWRRPSIHPNPADAGVASAMATASIAPPVASVPPPAPFQPAQARINPLQRVRCGASRTRASSGMTCDALPALEHAFVEAVQQSFDCAPKTAKEGTINHVLEIDFTRKTLHVFPGKSGDWHGPSARRTTKCVEHALGKPDFSSMQHAHAYYALAIMANYPAANSGSPTPSHDGLAAPMAHGISSAGTGAGLPPAGLVNSAPALAPKLPE
jgi:hypothetical protein